MAVMLLIHVAVHKLCGLLKFGSGAFNPRYYKGEEFCADSDFCVQKRFNMLVRLGKLGH